MDDFSFFLLKNWLPVGLSAIVFFAIGLLLAKFIWGRFTHRLIFAVEENLSLASQWNALGASQRDLFMKLRSRWQLDRDVWEATLTEKDARIAALTAQGSTERAVRNVSGPNASPTPARSEMEEASIEFQNRIKDLEQDLIDTHDELHLIRSQYQKQSELVESLEVRLIEMPRPSSPVVALNARTEEEVFGRNPDSSQLLIKQLEVLLSQRNRELKRYREQPVSVQDMQISSSEKTLQEEVGRLSIEVEKLSSELEIKQAVLDEKEGVILAKESEIEALKEKSNESEILKRRRIQLQAELNDSCHELYDVRKALNSRQKEMEAIAARLAVLEKIDSEKSGLTFQLNDLRHELSDVRLSYNEKVT